MCTLLSKPSLDRLHGMIQDELSNPLELRIARLLKQSGIRAADAAKIFEQAPLSALPGNVTGDIVRALHDIEDGSRK